MNIRYFFITDQVDAKELRIEYCDTDNMMADFFTKPLQGQLFKRMRNHIMNIDPNSKYYWDHRSVLNHDSGTGLDHDYKTAKKTSKENSMVTDVGTQTGL